MKMHPMLFPMPEGDAGSIGNILVLPGLFSETMNMIFESYEYFEFQDSLEDNLLPNDISLLMSNEMSRVTMRLTSIMAWLMARKAVLAGQLSEEDIAEHYKMDGEEYCLAHFPDMYDAIPDYMLHLLERSHQLYLRIWRLSQPAQTSFNL